jgi:uncharacterized protein (TIGR00645 family)
MPLDSRLRGNDFLPTTANAYAPPPQESVAPIWHLAEGHIHRHRHSHSQNLVAQLLEHCIPPGLKSDHESRLLRLPHDHHPLKSNRMFRKTLEDFVEKIVFASRWIQAPIYLGLIAGSAIYCAKFVWTLVEMVHEFPTATEEDLMLGVLGLVDMSMVANLVYMVVVGGWTMFVSKIDIADHPDRPSWLDSTNANTLKIKLASSLVGVSGIHLLKTFIELSGHQREHGPPQDIQGDRVMWQILIHVTFLGSALALAFTERLLHPAGEKHAHH